MASLVEQWDPVPSYFELISGIYRFMSKTVRENYLEKRELTPEEKSWHYFNFAISDIFLVLLLAAAFTVLRHYATQYVFKPLAQHFELTPTNQRKMPESAWKFLYYLCAWSLTLYVVILSGQYTFFQKPSTVWDGWSLDKPLPSDIYLLYVIQSGFYAHSLYATLVLDTWRKDSVVMMIHHVLTLALISISYSLRYHNIGSLVLFLHDVCDIQLEFTKLNVYFKTQGEKHVKIHETLANVTFFCFAITWFVSRLYWYPLKVLYCATSVVLQFNFVLPLAIPTNILLWILQAMNIYWFLFIVGFLLRVATGQVHEVEDTREYDVEEKFVKHLSEKLDSVSGTIIENGDVTSNGVQEKLMFNGEASGLKERRKKVLDR